MQSNRMMTVLMAAVIVGVLLVALGVRVAAVLPYALVLVCPLMMLWMMRRHES